MSASFLRRVNRVECEGGCLGVKMVKAKWKSRRTTALRTEPIDVDPDDHDRERNSDDNSTNARPVLIRGQRWAGGKRPSQSSYSWRKC